MAKTTIKIIGLDKVTKGLDKGARKPIEDALRELVVTIEGVAKKATPIGVSRFLGAEISHSFSGLQGTIHSPTEYASFVEYGTSKMEARHMEGATKILGQGMFGYALEKVKDYIKKFEDMIADKVKGNIQ